MADTEKHGTAPEGMEVFQVPEDYEIDREPGWYWWSCEPGSLPDGEEVGPFESREAAMEDAWGAYAAADEDENGKKD